MQSQNVFTLGRFLLGLNGVFWCNWIILNQRDADRVKFHQKLRGQTSCDEEHEVE